jgi:hypothetical protein
MKHDDEDEMILLLTGVARSMLKITRLNKQLEAALLEQKSFLKKLYEGVERKQLDQQATKKNEGSNYPQLPTNVIPFDRGGSREE